MSLWKMLLPLLLMQIRKTQLCHNCLPGPRGTQYPAVLTVLHSTDPSHSQSAERSKQCPMRNTPVRKSVCPLNPIHVSESPGGTAGICAGPLSSTSTTLHIDTFTTFKNFSVSYTLTPYLKCASSNAGYQGASIPLQEWRAKWAASS